MSERSTFWQFVTMLILALVVLALVLFSAWFAFAADGAFGHGPLPSGLTASNAYILTVLTSLLAFLSGGVTVVAVRQAKYLTPKFAWLTYVLVGLPLLALLFVPMKPHGAVAFMGLPDFLVTVPGRMVAATAIGALIITGLDIRRALPFLVPESARMAAAPQAGGTIVRGLPGRLTPNAWRALSFMQEEAHRFQHAYMGTEHLLLGILRDPRSNACRALVNIGVDIVALKGQVESIIGRRGSLYTGSTGMTRKCQRTIENAAKIARGEGQRVVGSGHLILSIAQDPDDVAGQALASAGVNQERLASELRHLGPEPE